MSVEALRFTPALLSKPVPRGLAAETTLHHFAIVTYFVDPSGLRRHLHPRFEPVCVDAVGFRRALVSVVTFLDRDFRFVAFPWFTRSFGQTNYRAYVQDTETGEHAAWFFGTCLDSWSVAVPRHLWKLPWHPARMAFDCRYDPGSKRYERYAVETQSQWAPADVFLEDTGAPPVGLTGLPTLEAALVLLTHPLKGYFFRRDGRLGSYAIWHDRAKPTMANVRAASYPLLERLELVKTGDLQDVHSAMIQPSIDFTIYLPPRALSSS